MRILHLFFCWRCICDRKTNWSEQWLSYAYHNVITNTNCEQIRYFQ